MKLKKFRIHNYKSILDSGTCAFAEDFTLLIGKNESGKTAVLEALRDFDRDAAIPPGAYPISAVDQEPRLEMTFTIAPDEIDAIAHASGLSIQDHVRQHLLEEGITLTKSFDGTYELNSEYLDQLFAEIPAPELPPADPGGDLSHLQSRINDLHDFLPPGAPLPDLTSDGTIGVSVHTQKLIGTAKARLMMIKEEERRNQAIEFLRSIVHDLKLTEESPVPVAAGPVSPRASFITQVVSRLPRFVFFSDEHDILPFKVSAKGIDANPAVQSFARIAGLDLKKVLQIEDMQRRINVLNARSVAIGNDFLGRWGQSRIELVVRPDGESLLFGVKESASGDLYKIEQRSKGFQWFLSFYLKLQSYPAGPVVVLIDEPGINLHPAAQKDILNLFQNKPNEAMQIIYSTHSPSLIEADHLERVRFVLKDPGKGSRLECDRQSIDQETLLPLQLAILSQLPTPMPVMPVQVPLPVATLVPESVVELPMLAAEEAPESSVSAPQEPATEEMLEPAVLAESDDQEPNRMGSFSWKKYPAS